MSYDAEGVDPLQTMKFEVGDIEFEAVRTDPFGLWHFINEDLPEKFVGHFTGLREVTAVVDLYKLGKKQKEELEATKAKKENLKNAKSAAAAD